MSAAAPLGTLAGDVPGTASAPSDDTAIATRPMTSLVP